MTDKNDDNKHVRSPVVVVVGHVDHGKTTLLDYIRKENVVEKEVGGITQSIGAYEIIHNGKKVTFIDTPGHEAFSTMRKRGASVADIAILVVAADEGVKTQTTEALNILKESETPFVVAITKTDTSNANVQKVKNELVSTGVLLEGAGGNISFQEVSGITGDGIDDLLDLIILTGEVEGLSYDPSLHANGFVLEAEKDSRRGSVAHVIIKNGTLRQGDEIVTQSVSGKVKILENFLGKAEKKLMPSAPAAIIGFNDIPKAGEEFWAGKVDIKVLGVMGEGESPVKVAEVIADITEDSGEELKEEVEKKVKVILNADTDGSLEALKQILDKEVQVIKSFVGNISDGDVQFAKSSKSTIFGFRVEVGKAAKNLADEQRVKIVTSEIIYELVDAVLNLKKKEAEEIKGGRLEVLAIFSATGSKQTVGGKVTEGALRVGAPISIERGEDVVGKGKIKNLQKDKADAREVVVGDECGLVIETETQIEKGDLIKNS